MIITRLLTLLLFIIAPHQILRGQQINGSSRSKNIEPIQHGSVVTERFLSSVLKENLIGINLNRSISVYLPPGYSKTQKRYPVIYYFHSLGGSNEKMFTTGNAIEPLLDRVISNGDINEFIMVVPDFSSPTLGSWFENSTTSGKWIDYVVKEIVPYIDEHFRTISNRDSRAISGEFIGGYGALKLAMLYPEIFSVVYALHPVGTGSGLSPESNTADWKRIYNAKSFNELWGDHYAPGFVAMSQAYLPNPERPPFYCDFIVDLNNGIATMNASNAKKLHANFFLDELTLTHDDNLRSLRGIAFDWGRYDQTQAHVYSNQAFTRQLDGLGITHIAEEYNGGPYDKNWISHGRVEDNMIPFLARHLVF